VSADGEPAGRSTCVDALEGCGRTGELVALDHRERVVVDDGDLGQADPVAGGAGGRERGRRTTSTPRSRRRSGRSARRCPRAAARRLRPTDGSTHSGRCSATKTCSRAPVPRTATPSRPQLRTYDDTSVGSADRVGDAAGRVDGEQLVARTRRALDRQPEAAAGAGGDALDVDLGPGAVGGPDRGDGGDDGRDAGDVEGVDAAGGVRRVAGGVHRARVAGLAGQRAEGAPADRGALAGQVRGDDRRDAGCRSPSS
jgi:hypothetical protein